MITAIIAEKPSVAREIAAIVGATQKNEGYLSGNKHLVTWAFGHLVQLAMPDQYGIKGFNKEHLPILPDPFILKIRQVKDIKSYKDDPGATKQINIIKDGLSQSEAEEEANAVLFDGLHFSKHDTLVNIVWNEFSGIIPESQAKAFAVKILPECSEVFSGYQLSDDFAASNEYDKLYTELVGFISIWLEENEL